MRKNRLFRESCGLEGAGRYAPIEEDRSHARRGAVPGASGTDRAVDGGGRGRGHERPARGGAGGGRAGAVPVSGVRDASYPDGAQRRGLLSYRVHHVDRGRRAAGGLRFRTFWEYRYPGAARTFFTRWYWRATHSRLKPLAAVAKLIQRHLPNPLTYLRHHLTNAGLEGVNAVIQWVKKTARGFRNAEHFKTAIYFHCGGLDLYPHESR